MNTNKTITLTPELARFLLQTVNYPGQKQLDPKKLAAIQAHATGRLYKLVDEPRPCLSREHNPPGHMVLSPGTTPVLVLRAAKR